MRMLLDVSVSPEGAVDSVAGRELIVPSQEIRGDDFKFLRSQEKPRSRPGRREIRILDLYSGCGGLSLGAVEAFSAAGLSPVVSGAIDTDPNASAVFGENFPSSIMVRDPIETIFDRPDLNAVTRAEASFKEYIGPIDLIVAGPPCQGHSDLNNYSRRNDARNGLYAYVARAAKVFSPSAIIVENVQGLPHDKSGTLSYTEGLLRDLDYQVSSRLIDVATLGVAQKRRRHVLIATKRLHAGFEATLERFRMAPRSVSWAIKDLMDCSSASIFDQSANASPDNRRRMQYLFDNGLFELPNAQRPPCHRDKHQTYTSVYGRMSWEAPAQTVTSGFYSMCMGRYVHPDRMRTLTAHEAARLQFFPDFFSFGAATGRTHLAKMIGNAVPPKLSYAVTSALIEAQQFT